MPTIQKISVLILGERSFPLFPATKLSGGLVSPPEGLLEEAKVAAPLSTMDDVVAAIWAIGQSQLRAALASGASLRSGGVLERPNEVAPATPVEGGGTEPKKPSKPDPKKAALLGLASVVKTGAHGG